MCANTITRWDDISAHIIEFYACNRYHEYMQLCSELNIFSLCFCSDEITRWQVGTERPPISSHRGNKIEFSLCEFKYRYACTWGCKGYIRWLIYVSLELLDVLENIIVCSILAFQFLITSIFVNLRLSAPYLKVKLCLQSLMLTLFQQN